MSARKLACRTADRLGARAADPMVWAWVSANAGAGKTHLLANRVTRLLLGGAEPQRILCLTYTKAAANEMAHRLFDRLGKWALLDDKSLAAALAEIGAGRRSAADIKHARTLFAQALETPGGLKIQTIHAFCQQVLTRFPVEAGVAPRFTVLDERSAAELMRLARTRVLERAAAGDNLLAAAVATLATRAGETQFGEAVDLAVGQTRGKLRAILEKHRDLPAYYVALRKELGVAPGLDDEDVTERFCARLGDKRPMLERAVNTLGTGGATDRKQAEKLKAYCAAAEPTLAFEAVRGFFLTDAGRPRKSLASKSVTDAEPALINALEALAVQMLAAEEERKAAATATLTEAVVTVAQTVLGAYDAAKRARATLDYDDLTVRTRALLERAGAADWVLYKLDGGLDHILVDEAQDTSPEQWAIVRKLVEEFLAGEGARDAVAKGRTLFAVGDEKQSVFSFQGAEPNEFGRNRKFFKMRAEDAQLMFEDLNPPTARRGAKAVLSFVDAVFAREEAHAGLTLEGGPTHHKPHRKALGRVELWPAVKPPPRAEHDPLDPVDAPPPGGAHVLLAAHIAERIAGWVANGTELPGHGRAIQPRDIMILVRRRAALAQELIRQLLVRDVTVAGADRMNLAEQIAVADLVALGRFALLPQDDLNLAALLKSPILGLSEDALFELAHGRQGRLWAALIERARERPDFSESHALLATVLERADYETPFDFYGRVLAAGARKRLTARLGAEAADAIDEFLALALAYEGAHPPALEGFLDWFARGADEVKRDMEEGGGAVRVMTVHGAKGLEAPIVIVPDTAQAPTKEAQGPLLYTDDFVFYGGNQKTDTGAVRAAKAAATAREAAEYRRLLYVALTRACDWLIVCGYENYRGGAHPQSWYALIEAAAAAEMRPEWHDDGTEYRAMGAPHPAPVGKTEARMSAAPAFPDLLKRAAVQEAERPRILWPSDAPEEEPALISPLSNAKTRRFRRGLIMHALLAALPALPGTARESAALRYAARQGLSEEDAATTTKEVIAVLDDAQFAPLFGPRSRAEIAIVADLPELGAPVRVSGQIDRLVVDDQRVLIADFKTNRPPPAHEDDTPGLYRRQMALYRAALRKIYPGKRVACALIWTEGPRLMRLSDSLLDMELQQITARLVE